MLLFLFRCQCGREKADHECNSEVKKDKPWTPSDVKLDDTNAQGETKLHDISAIKNILVTIKLIEILSLRAMVSMFSKTGKEKQENLVQFRCAGIICSV